MKHYFYLGISIFALSILSCKKTKTTTNCDACNPINNTVFFAIDWVGKIAYNNDIKKWTVNVSIPNTIDGIRTCILCTEISDSLKLTGKTAIFSGDVKETCASSNPQIGGQEIYSISPSKIQ